VGTRPRYAPIERPSRRCQSPISTANPNAVNVDTPRRHPSRVTTGVNMLSPAIHGDRGVEPVAAGEGDQHGVVGDVERQLQPGQRNLLGAQPALVHPGPRLALVVDDPLAQQQLRKPVPRGHQIRADILAGPHQVPGCFLLDAGHRDRDDLTQVQQPRQVPRIPHVGLDPIPRRALHSRRGRDQALDAFIGQVSSQTEPVGPAS
jgi:hypothetical protein